MKIPLNILIRLYSIIPFATTEKRFEIENIYHFSSKDFLSSSPENTLKSVATLEFFTYESIKVCNFVNMVCFSRDLNLFCFSELRDMNKKTYFQSLLLLSGDTYLSSILMISGLPLKREVFILCIFFFFYLKLLHILQTETYINC